MGNVIKQISKYLFPTLLAFLAGYLLWQIQRERVSLDYEIVESASFPREGGIGQYFIVRLRNSGSVAVEKVQLDIDFQTGAVESTSLSDSKITANVIHDSSSVQASIPLLNPAETLSLTVTTFGTPQVERPRVSARALGVTAVPRDNGITGSGLVILLLWILLVILLMAFYLIYTTYRSSKISDSISKIEGLGQVSDKIKKSENALSTHFKRLSTELEQDTRRRKDEFSKLHEEQEKKNQDQDRRYEEGEPEREAIIFSVFNRAGLGDRFAELVGSANEVTYWKAGLSLLYWFLGDEARRDSYLKAAEALAGTHLVQPSSTGFILYVLGKMEQFRGNRDGAIRWFNECKKRTPLMYEHLMAQDPAFDLESISRALGKFE